VAITGKKATEHAGQTEAALSQAALLLGVGISETPAAARELTQSVRDLRKALSAGSKLSIAPTSRPATGDGRPAYGQIKAALRETARILNVGLFDVPARIQSLLEERKSLEEQIARLGESGVLSADSLLAQAKQVGDIAVIAAEAPAANANLMRQVIDQLRKKQPRIAVLLGASEGPDKVLLVAGLSKDLVDRGLSAGTWVKEVAKIVGGSGGGKPDLAQAGGKDAFKLPDAIAKAVESLAAQVR
jgi:alanyl-tRNA synthetase